VSIAGVPIDAGPSEAPAMAYRRDYLRIAAWLFAFLFGPALVATIVLLV
jgi:hypothetical protein